MLPLLSMNKKYLLMFSVVMVISSVFLWNRFSNKAITNSLDMSPIDISEGLSADLNINNGRYCYLKKTPTPTEFGDNYNYEFTAFSLNDNQVSGGVFYYYPYGTDSQQGSFTGTYTKTNNTILITGYAWGEGDLYSITHTYTITKDSLILDTNTGDELALSIPRIDCSSYDTTLKQFHGDKLNSTINTTDTTRLQKIPDIARDIKNGTITIDDIQFSEIAVDLDNNYETSEYLLYPVGMNFCGSGGCNLYITNEVGVLLSKMTVVETPIYITKTTSKTPKNTWNNLYVWSNGAYRTMVFNGKNYPTNPSTQPTISSSDIENHPELYQLLLNF